MCQTQCKGWCTKMSKTPPYKQTNKQTKLCYKIHGLVRNCDLTTKIRKISREKYSGVYLLSNMCMWIFFTLFRHHHFLSGSRNYLFMLLSNVLFLASFWLPWEKGNNIVTHNAMTFQNLFVLSYVAFSAPPVPNATYLKLVLQRVPTRAMLNGNVGLEPTPAWEL